MIKKEEQGLNFSAVSRNALLVAFFTFLAQLLSLVRDKLMSSTMGAGIEFDTYIAAFKVPDIIFVLTSSVVSAAILIPFLQRHQERYPAIPNKVLQYFLIILLVVSVAAWLLLPFTKPLLAPGFSPLAFENLVRVSRVMLLSPLLLGLSNFFISFAQYQNRFLGTAIAPVLYNLGGVVGILLFYPVFGLDGLIYGVILGAILHLLIQGKTGTLIFKKSKKSKKEKIPKSIMKRLFLDAIPRTITLSMQKIYLLLLVGIFSLSGLGAITLFQLAYNLQAVVVALFAVSLVMASFPGLSKQVVALATDTEQRKKMQHIWSRVVDILMFWMLPIVCSILLLAPDVVMTIYGGGNFTMQNVLTVSSALQLFAFSMIFQGLSLLSIRVLYAAGKVWRPFWVSLGTFGGALLFTYVFMKFVNPQQFLAITIGSGIFTFFFIMQSKLLLLAVRKTIGIRTHCWNPKKFLAVLVACIGVVALNTLPIKVDSFILSLIVLGLKFGFFFLVYVILLVIQKDYYTSALFVKAKNYFEKLFFPGRVTK